MVRGKKSCGLCGREEALGYASVIENDQVISLCHPDGPEPDCYQLWTVYSHRPGAGVG